MKKRGIEIKINISNRWIYTLIVIGVLAIVGVGFVMATWDTSKTVWHSADNVKVTIGASDKSLQEAIIDEDFGGTNTNAGIICSGANQFLAGDGNCKTGYLDADGIDSEGGIISTGLYGLCVQGRNCPNYEKSPAYCNTNNICMCPTGFSKIQLGESLAGNRYSCYKN